MASIGIDIGGTKIAAAVVKNGAIVCQTKDENIYVSDNKRLVAFLLSRISDIASCTDEKIESIGIGCPGWVIDNIVYNAPNLGIVELPLKAVVEAHTGIPTLVENDARTALLGEMKAGIFKGCKNGAMITIGTGIGGAMLIDGHIYKGSFGYAGEIGHMIYKKGGRLCECGKKGCWEKYASASALMKLAGRYLRNRDTIAVRLCRGNLKLLNGEILVKAVEAGDEIIARVFDEYTDILADGLNEIITLLDFDMVALGGGISSAGDILMKPIREKVHKVNARCSVTVASLRNAAGLIGAALLHE